MRPFLRIALGFYVLAIGLGLVLRAAFLWPIPGLVFSNALHAHSHTLYFGWAGLAVFALGFLRVGAEGRAVRAVLGSIVAISAATFVAFLYGGYSLPGIIVSAASVFVWGAAGTVLWRRTRGQPGVDVAFLRVALGYMGLALLGALGRVVLLAAHVTQPLYGALAVFAFLHDFAWFFLFAVMGFALTEAKRAGVVLDEAALRRQLRWMAGLAWLTFPLGVHGGDVGVLGVVARGAALLLVVPEALWVRSLWRAARTVRGASRAGLLSLAGWFSLKVAMELGGAFGLAGQAVALRHPAILFLHVMLVGCVTLGLMAPLLRVLGRPLGHALHLHNGGLAVMGLGLALLGLAGLGFGQLSRAGFVLAAVGGAGIVLAAVVWMWPRRRAARVEAQPAVVPAPVQRGAWAARFEQTAR